MMKILTVFLARFLSYKTFTNLYHKTCTSQSGRVIHKTTTYVC